MSLLMSVTKPHGIASGVYLGLCYEATGSSTALLFLSTLQKHVASYLALVIWSSLMTTDN